MNIEKVKEFIKLAKENELAELKYESKDEKISVKLPYGQAPVLSQSMPSTQPVQTAVSAAPLKDSGNTNDGLIEIKCPFVGTFYRSSSPESAPYAKVGQKVGSGDVLCIVEAMKIMNEIEAEVSGEIAEICVENETYVEFGQVLFKIKP
ncbi:acetyl-CoA carboxylase biotin carboxyl carrier protein [Bacteriovoracaceae bacterium]|nr:acetyl-CoA carboxylase biotin carboxyl carrier protein [Bacteriovoracaceae bacterium]|tara:strand:+ start:244832 stop:245278 length:447 start_codon:yes stop_codon:yes gene_type:complete